MNVLKFCAWLVAVLLIVSLAFESVEARKRNRKHRKRSKVEKKLNKREGRNRHHRKRDHLPIDMGLEDNVMRSMIGKIQRWKRPTVHPKIRGVPQMEVDEWRVATIFAKLNNTNNHHQATAKVGHHSKTVNISGRLVHIFDPDMKNHYGCAGAIGNLKDIPTNGAWIALVQRGKCRFFNKIRLARLHNASAIIIYNHKEGTEVMNTAGTAILSIMIGKSDGKKFASLGKDVYVKISIHNKTRTSDDLEMTTASTPPSAAISQKGSLLLTLTLLTFSLLGTQMRST